MKRPVSPIPAEPLEIFDPTPPSFWERARPWLLGTLLISLMLGLALAFRHYEWAQYVDKAALRDLIAPFGTWAPAVFVGACIVGTLSLLVPFSLMAGVAGLLFGTAWGSFWTVIGCTLGTTLLIFMVRVLGGKWLQRRFDQTRWQNLNERFAQDGFFYLLLVRTLAVIPYALFNAACGLINVRYRDVFFANLVGLIPSALLYSYGTQLLLNPQAPLAPFLGFMGLLACVIVTPFVFRGARRRRRRQLQRL